MTNSNLFAACLLALFACQGFSQSFPAKPITLNCPCPRAAVPEKYAQGLAAIAAKYLGQPLALQAPPGELQLMFPLDVTRKASPDGYTLSMTAMPMFRIPFMRRVDWDPTRDFTYIIGLARYTYGIVVRSDSQFQSLKDLIDYAKANPGALRYGSIGRGATQHLNMEELGILVGARFLHVPGTVEQSIKALNEKRIMAISEISDWKAQVESGAFRLLVTFGEQRSKWNAPTARELGLNILSYAPFGIVGPRGMDPKVTKLLHDAFNRALDDPEYAGLLTRLDLVDWYRSSEEYAEWAVDQFRYQGKLIERTYGLFNN